jgi:hypothetical protein
MNSDQPDVRTRRHELSDNLDAVAPNLIENNKKRNFLAYSREARMPSNRRFPWQGSFRAIPAAIETQLAAIASNLLQVAATKRIPVSEIAGGSYKHVGLRHTGSEFEVHPDIPQEDVGELERAGRPMSTRELAEIICQTEGRSPQDRRLLADITKRASKALRRDAKGWDRPVCGERRTQFRLGD